MIVSVRTAAVVALVGGAVVHGVPAAGMPRPQHACVASADPAPIAAMSSGASAALPCFDSLAAAVAFASGGTVTFPATTPRDVVLRQLGPALLRLAADTTAHPDDADAGDTIIGIDHDIDFIDEDLVWSVSNTRGCLGGATYKAHAMPSGWNDKVDSATAYQGCTAWVHYEDIDYGGSTRTCTCATMGVMEDETSSEQWAPAANATGTLELLDPIDCPILASLAPGIPGLLDIDSTGDTYVIGVFGRNFLYDCPPYVV